MRGYIRSTYSITTKHRVHLANIMRKIGVMPDVLRVNRTTNKIRSKESS